jgi:hypothetical protein
LNSTINDFCKRSNKKIILLYKVQYRIQRVIREIIESGENKYWYIGRARNLVWALLIQGIMNDQNYNSLSERYGSGFTGGFESDYMEVLKRSHPERYGLLLGKLLIAMTHIKRCLTKKNMLFLGQKRYTQNACQSQKKNIIGRKNQPSRYNQRLSSHYNNSTNKDLRILYGLGGLLII